MPKAMPLPNTLIRNGETQDTSPAAVTRLVMRGWEIKQQIESAEAKRV